MSKKNDIKPTNPKQPLQGTLTEGVDFYIENGLYVFTELFLTQRGYCCGNDCRHCPYNKGNLQIKNEKNNLINQIKPKSL